MAVKGITADAQAKIIAALSTYENAMNKHAYDTSSTTYIRKYIKGSASEAAARQVISLLMSELRSEIKRDINVIKTKAESLNKLYQSADEYAASSLRASAKKKS